MIKGQYWIEEEQHKKIKREAKARKVTESSIIREIITRAYELSRPDIKTR